MTPKNPEHNHKRKSKEERATWALAVLTGIVAIFTAALAIAAFLTMRQEHLAASKQLFESRRATLEQLGVQTWLYVDPQFDSKELKKKRKELAQQLDPYEVAKREEVNDDVLNFFESVGLLYRQKLLNKNWLAHLSVTGQFGIGKQPKFTLPMSAALSTSNLCIRSLKRLRKTCKRPATSQ